MWEVAGGVEGGEGGEGEPCEGVRGAEPQTRWEEEGEELHNESTHTHTINEYEIIHSRYPQQQCYQVFFQPVQLYLCCYCNHMRIKQPP